MKKWLVIAILGVGIFFTTISSYNGLVQARENVNAVWAKVESQYQRRADLIPNLVNTVRGQANFEQETLTKVIDARAKATQIRLDPANLTAENLQAFQQQQNAVGSALSRLLVTVERYPELKANEGFLTLQAQLEGTENRITVARNNFNDVARGYNQKIHSFPNILIAKLFGFQEKPYFSASAGAETAPTVTFN
ncbi:LemA family protein [Mergibacter septicus]|uniref:LemA family protein n=1 Tax=Mergibacter septicus TaxID=221402 RepID=UPI001178D29A|nr:LemA family protein [Mergibacter septicus]AWX13759.1 LemA family protein [Mergibacter septicus]